MIMGNQMELPPFTTKGTSFSKTCLNGINALLGIGLITIPYTLSKAGWLSIVFLLAMAIITCYTCFLLQRCLDSNPAIKTYDHISSHAFGRKGKLIISTFMYLELYLVPTGFLITESDNLYKLFPNIGIQVGSHYIGGKKFFTLVSGLVILPTMWLKNLSLLSFVSAGGVFSSVVIICSIFWAGAFNGVGFSSRGKLFEFSGIPTALSLYAFCYGAHPVFPTLYTSMKDKSRFSKVLFISFGLSTVCYVAIGVIGYLMFGEKAQSQVTLNLPTNAISSKIAIYTTLVGPVAKYALIITPISEAIEAHLPEVLNIRPIWMILRALLLATTMIAALSFPYFGVVMAFVGAVLNVAVSVLFPCICYLKLCGSHKKWGFEEMIILGIVVMAISLAAVGTFSSVKDIVNHL